MLNDEGVSIIADGFLSTVAKYRDLVRGNGGELIVGIQGFNQKIVDSPPDYAKGIAELYNELQAKSNATHRLRSFVGDNRIK